MTDRKHKKQIRDREEPGTAGPWKWQLIHAIQAVEQKLDQVLKAVNQVGSHSETARKLSEAGKKSAAARKAKFGSAKPGAAQAAVETKPVLDQGVMQLFEQVREGVQETALGKKALDKQERTPGGMVWKTYSVAYRNRHKVDPIRNVKVNAHCKQLVAQVGVEMAISVVGYFVDRDDAFYVNAKHPLGLCVLDLQKLCTEMQTDTVVTMTDARRGEVASQSDRAIRQYLKTQVSTERVREPVHVNEVENAD